MDRMAGTTHPRVRTLGSNTDRPVRARSTLAAKHAIPVPIDRHAVHSEAPVTAACPEHVRFADPEGKPRNCGMDTRASPLSSRPTVNQPLNSLPGVDGCAAGTAPLREVTIMMTASSVPPNSASPSRRAFESKQEQFCGERARHARLLNRKPAGKLTAKM